MCSGFLRRGLVQVSLFSHTVNFSFFKSHSPVTTLGLNQFAGTFLNKLLFLWYPVVKNNSIQEVHQIRCFFPYKMETELASETLCFFKKLDDGRVPKKEDCVG